MSIVKKEGIDNLNAKQLAAVKHTKGPLLIIAGAGTGKTTVITERVKHIILEKMARPEEILALTFTEKAALEMEKRVDIALPYGTFGLWISTFHSFCDRILRAEALHIGLSHDFRLLTEAELYLFVKNHFWKFEFSYFRPNANPYKFIAGLLSHFSRLKDEDVSYKEYLAFAEKKRKGVKPEDKEMKEEAQKFMELASAYKIYEELKAKEGVMDFSDLIGNVLKLFRSRPSLLSMYRRKFRYILIDEFQDTNFAQYQLIKLLAPPLSDPNLSVVGDDSQSIYKFRGAAISNILSFMHDYPKASQVLLTTSYRCSQSILSASYRLITNNNPNTLEAQLGINKNLTAFDRRKGEPIDFFYLPRVEDEAQEVARFILTYKKEHNKAYKDFAILVRANNHSDPFIRAFEREHIPYQFLGPGMLFAQPEVRDLIAYLKVLYDFNDSVSLYRVLSAEIFGVEARDIIAVLSVGKRSNNSLFEQLEKIDEVRNISESSRKKIIQFVEMVHRHQKLIPSETAGQILYYFLEDSGLLKKVYEYHSAEGERRALNISKFFDKLKSFEAMNKDASVFSVVDYFDLTLQTGESPAASQVDWSENNAVNILTLHSAKGLEFDIVILANLVEGRFPSRERREQISIPEELIREQLPTGDYHIQEERRLFYVGMTRAKEKLIMTAANYYGEGKRERKISPYVAEALGHDKTSFIPKPNTSSQIPLFDWSTKTNSIEQVTGTPSFTPVDYLSYSAIEAFKICPLHFKLRHILRIPTLPTAAQARGNSIHYALRDFGQMFLTGSKPSVKDKDILFGLLAKNWIKWGYKSREHEKESHLRALNFLEEYLKSDLHKTGKPIYLERPFNFRVRHDLKILGKIDRIDNLGGGNIHVIDYKTGARVPTKKELDQNMQMTIYALAATDPGILAKEISKIKFSFYFFENGSLVSTVRTQNQLEAAKLELIDMRDQISTSDFSCSHSIICRDCEYKIFCG